MPNLSGTGRDSEGDIVAPPSTRKDAHLLGQVCLTEALTWAQRALQTIELSPNLNQEADIKSLVSKDIVECVILLMLILPCVPDI